MKDVVTGTPSTTARTTTGLIGLDPPLALNVACALAPVMTVSTLVSDPHTVGSIEKLIEPSGT